MRLYTFNNMYLSSLQNGLQSAHATAELFIKYPDWNGAIDSKLWDWARNYKTMILLNGGYLESIQELVEFFDNDYENPYPWADFHEGEDALGGILTTVGIILPEKIYLTAAFLNERQSNSDTLTISQQLEARGNFVVGKDNTLGFNVEEQTTIEISKWEYDLINRLNRFKLAR